MRGHPFGGYRLVVFAGDDIEFAVNLETVVIIIVVVTIGPRTRAHNIRYERMRVLFKPVFSGVGQAESLKASQGQRKQKHL